MIYENLVTMGAKMHWIKMIKHSKIKTAESQDNLKGECEWRVL